MLLFIFFFAIIVTIVSAISILLLIFGQRYILKPLVIILIIISSILSFYNNQFGVTVDEQMIINTLQTDINEVVDLISFDLLFISFLGIVPSLIVYFIKIEYETFKKDLFLRFLFTLSAFIIVILIIFLNFKQVSFITRQHKNLINILHLYTH